MENEEGPRSNMATVTTTWVNEEESQQEPKKKPRLNKYALGCAILASTNSILLGYDIGVMSGAVLSIKDQFNITSSQVEILVGSLNVVSLFGSIASGKTSDYIGRRYTIVVAAMTFLVGALVMGSAPNYGVLLAGRVIAGIGVGYALMISPVYVAEVSPTLTRGFLSSLPELFINIGILIGYIVNVALTDVSQKINWRLMLGLAGVPAVGIIIGVLQMPESPRWLVMKGRVEEARRVLRKTSETEEEAQDRLDDITKAATQAVGPNDIDPESSKSATEQDWHGQGVWKEIFMPTRQIRRILIIAVGINFFMQASGNDAVVYYTPSVFKNAGIKTRKGLIEVTIIMGLAKTSFVLVSALFLDQYGRRPLLLLGTTGQALSLAGLGISSMFLQHAHKKPVWAIAMSIVAVCADVSFFSIGLGPITWVYTSEIFPIRLRAQGSALAVSVNRVVSGAVSMSFLSVSEKITFGGTFFVLSGVMVIATIFFFFFLPETKGLGLEEIGEIFEDKEDQKRSSTSKESEMTPVT
ncbi:OLC1v1037297C1 [Oldenlandia corymbosa var. corymbosa]|uniref:OLC1v1037297C1 n=1 Tax=Oldenlandia corymbosa var. corymbosa TaxID=529605 RepID=A0AAV1CX83_OLDCO|nr:OLC1v1037297C1 [Oldenlandia corymbosa var. corymbosa]